MRTKWDDAIDPKERDPKLHQPIGSSGEDTSPEIVLSHPRLLRIRRKPKQEQPKEPVE